MGVLTPEQRQHFLEKGFVKIEDAVPIENLGRFCHDVWIRLGYDPSDKSTWTQEKVHMPRHREEPMKTFAPKAWEAICEIVGGEDRIDDSIFSSFGDSLICNFGTPAIKDKESIDPKLLGNWHIDGDWFQHYLDSGEQAVTVIVLFNDIEPRAGGTFLAPDGIKNVVKWLYEHPEGSDGWPVDETGARTVCDIHSCKDFVECTGKKGDVIIFHPFMPHSASKNYKRIPRFITNPPVTLKEQLHISRDDSADYSLTELVVRNALLSLGLSEGQIRAWRPAGPRKRFTPRTRAGKDAMIMAEVERMKAYALKSGGAYKVESMHINGPVQYQVVVPTES